MSVKLLLMKNGIISTGAYIWEGKKSEEMAAMLINAGVPINAGSTIADTAVFFTIKYERPAILRVLLEANADITRIGESAETYLRFCIAKGGEVGAEMTGLLLNAGALEHVTEADKERITISVLSSRQPKILQLLICAKVDVCKTDYNEWTCLYWCLQFYGEKSLEMIEMLIKAGVDVNAVTRYKETALHVAAEKGYLDVVKILLAAKADIYKRKLPYDKTAFHLAAEHGHNEIVQLFLQAGINSNLPAKDRKTAVQYAGERGHLGIVELLISRGAPVNFENNSWCPLHYAARKGDTEVARRLVTAGAKIDGSDPHNTPLQEAADYGHVEMVKFLLAAGALVNIHERYEYYRVRTFPPALYRAVSKGHEEIVRILIAAGEKDKYQTY